MRKLAIVGGLSGLAATGAHAELPAGVLTAITGYQTDTLAAITAVITAGVVIWALFKLGRKLGWF